MNGQISVNNNKILPVCERNQSLTSVRVIQTLRSPRCLQAAFFLWLDSLYKLKTKTKQEGYIMLATSMQISDSMTFNLLRTNASLKKTEDRQLANSGIVQAYYETKILGITSAIKLSLILSAFQFL